MGKATRIKTQHKQEAAERKRKLPTKQEMLDGVDKDGNDIVGVCSKKYILAKIKADIEGCKLVDKYLATKNIITTVTNVQVIEHKMVIKYLKFAEQILNDVAKYVEGLTVEDLEKLDKMPFDNGNLDITKLPDDDNLHDTLIKQIIEGAVVAPYNKDILNLKNGIENCED